MKPMKEPTNNIDAIKEIAWIRVPICRVMGKQVAQKYFVHLAFVNITIEMVLFSS
jgi:hypothetical protein